MSGTYEYHPPSEFVRKVSEDKFAAGQRFGEAEAAKHLQAAREETARAVAKQLRAELGRTVGGCIKTSLQRIGFTDADDLIGDLTKLTDDLIKDLTNADLSGSYYSDGTIDFTEANLTNADLSGWTLSADEIVGPVELPPSTPPVPPSTPPPVESCDEPAQTVPFCVTGVTPSDGQTAQEKRDLFCAGSGASLCPVSCGTCIVESCDDLSTTNPECRLGVTPDQDFAAQEKKDKYCTLLAQTKCPVSCMGVTTEGPKVCQPAP